MDLFSLRSVQRYNIKPCHIDRITYERVNLNYWQSMPEANELASIQVYIMNLLWLEEMA